MGIFTPLETFTKYILNIIFTGYIRHNQMDAGSPS